MNERLRITALPCMLEEAVMALRDHGCTIEQDEYRVIITFPPGTTRKEICPRLMNERYMLVFGDGYKVMEQVIREKRMSVLFYMGE